MDGPVGMRDVAVVVFIEVFEVVVVVVSGSWAWAVMCGGRSVVRAGEGLQSPGGRGRALLGHLGMRALWRVVVSVDSHASPAVYP